MIVRTLLSLAAAALVTLPASHAQSCSSKAADDTARLEGGAAAALVAAAVTSPHATPKTADGRDLIDTAVEAGSFRTLATALRAAGLVDALRADGPFTVFAPTDAAFAKLPDGTLESLLRPEARAKLASILTFHVVPGRLDAAAVMEAPFLTTLNGQRLAVRVEGESVFVGGARVATANVEASNGLIHVLDGVLLPVDASVVDLAVADGGFTTLVAALRAAGLVETLQGDGPFTVFAPTDAAFAKLPAGTVESLLEPANKDRLVAILTLHVVSGRVHADEALEAGTAASLQGGALQFKQRDGKVYVNSAAVLAADLEGRNGLVHVIDEVLLPRE